MPPTPSSIIWFAHLHHQELLAEADQERLADRARPARSGGRRLSVAVPLAVAVLIVLVSLLVAVRQAAAIPELPSPVERHRSEPPAWFGAGSAAAWVPATPNPTGLLGGKTRPETPGFGTPGRSWTALSVGRIFDPRLPLLAGVCAALPAPFVPDIDGAPVLPVCVLAADAPMLRSPLASDPRLV